MLAVEVRVEVAALEETVRLDPFVLAPEMEVHHAVLPLEVELVQEGLEAEEGGVDFGFVLAVEPDGVLEGQVGALDDALADLVHVLGEAGPGDHGVLGLGECEGAVLHVPVEVGVEVVVVLEQVVQGHPGVVVAHVLELHLHEVLLRLGNEPVHLLLDLLQLVEVLEPVLHQRVRVVYLLPLVYDVEASRVLALLIAHNLLPFRRCLAVALGPAQDYCLPVPALALDQDLGLAGELLTLLAIVADLLTLMAAVRPALVALLEAPVFANLLAGARMALN